MVEDPPEDDPLVEDPLVDAAAAGVGAGKKRTDPLDDRILAALGEGADFREEGADAREVGADVREEEAAVQEVGTAAL